MGLQGPVLAGLAFLQGIHLEVVPDRLLQTGRGSWQCSVLCCVHCAAYTRHYVCLQLCLGWPGLACWFSTGGVKCACRLLLLQVKNPWPNVDAHSGVLLQYYNITGGLFSHPCSWRTPAPAALELSHEAVA